MSKTPAEQLIQYRLQQANESIQEAEALYHSALLRGVVNRAYYAMFYAVLALIVLRQEAISKHSGVIAFFDREFVKAGLFSTTLSKSLHLAFQRRQENDYGEVFIVSQEDAYQAITEAQSFVSAVSEYLASASR